MEYFLNNDIEDDISEASSDDEDYEPENFIDLINNHPDIPLDVEEMEEYIEDIVELYELQYRRRPNESGDPPNILVIRHLVEHERDILFDLPDDGNGLQNQFQNLQLDYHPTSSGGDMPQYFLEERDIENVNTVNIMVEKKVRLVKTRYKTTKRASIDNLSRIERHDQEEITSDESSDSDGIENNLVMNDFPARFRRPRTFMINEGEPEPWFNIVNLDVAISDPTTNTGDMPYDFLDEIEDFTNIVKKEESKREKQYKKRTKGTITKRTDNFRKSKKSRFRSESSLRKKLLTYRRQSDVYIRRYGYQ